MPSQASYVGGGSNTNESTPAYISTQADPTKKIEAKPTKQHEKIHISLRFVTSAQQQLMMYMPYPLEVHTTQNP